jgi:hypothetical protein
MSLAFSNDQWTSNRFVVEVKPTEKISLTLQSAAEIQLSLPPEIQPDANHDATRIREDGWASQIWIEKIRAEQIEHARPWHACCGKGRYEPNERARFHLTRSLAVRVWPEKARAFNL